MKTTSITPIQKPVRAEVSVPGSKSYTNRALILAALTAGSVHIKNPLFSDDISAMLDCLKRLGIHSRVSEDSIEVYGGISAVEDKEYDLDANLSGTTIRFILALATLVPGVKTIRGRGRLNERPIADLVDALRQLGADITYLGNEGYPPVSVRSSSLRSGTIEMNGSVSSQFLSAVLMIAPLVGDVSIRVKGLQISQPYIDMTLDTMKRFGVSANHADSEYRISSGQSYNATEYTVEGDASSAAYFFAMAALTGSTITVKNMNPESLQADMGFLSILEDMGNVVERGTDSITLTGKGIVPVSVDMKNCPDQVQTLAALAAIADGMTHITGVASLRVKETERVAAIERELAKMGIRTESTADTLTVYGGTPKAAVIDTYWDHRMAMAFAVLGLKLPGMEIRNPGVVSKTFPEFWEILTSIGVETRIAEKDPNIVLIGMRGSGKTTIARLLAKRLGKEYVDLDKVVEGKAGMTIADMVAKNGWEPFRKLETETVREMSARDGAVISTGGGIITRQENIEAIKRNGLCVFLSAPIEVLMSRIRDDDSRPALTSASTPKEEMEKILIERDPLYSAAADETIDVARNTPSEAVDEIMVKLKARGIIEK